MQLAVHRGIADRAVAALEAVHPRASWRAPAVEGGEIEFVHLLIHSARSQAVMDAIGRALGGSELEWHLTVVAAEAVLREPDDPEEQEKLDASTRRWRARRSRAHLDAVPDDFPAIDLVVQDAVAALGISIDDRGVPARISWRWHGICIERGGDRARTFIGRIAFEDAPDHLGFVVGDLELARPSGHGSVPVGPAASVPASRTTPACPGGPSYVFATLSPLRRA